ncbi:MAG: hypothetical protein JRI23_00630, partial [Deltaproteobacteria bacterium]|nr:hypothetical protein [Deltaproteobacteria bacterium]MBW2529955.1 hypothetical protein [Deltaproteobacteria bacterium]
MSLRGRRFEMRFDLAPSAAVASLVLLVGVGLSACGSGVKQRPPDQRGGVEPSHPSAAAGVITVVSSRGRVPLRGHRVDARPGDLMIRKDDQVAVVSAVTGQLVDFAATGQRDGLTSLASVAFDGLSAMSDQVEHIAPVGDGGRVLYVRRRLHERPLSLHVWYAFAGEALAIESMLSSQSDEPLAAVTLGEEVAWGNVPTWVSGHGFVREGGDFGGDFIGRDAHGAAYAMCSTAGRLMARFRSPALPGYHRSARTGEQVVSLAARGRTPRRRILLGYRAGSLGHAAMSLPCVPGVPAAAVPALAKAAPGASLELARCTTDGAPGAL